MKSIFKNKKGVTLLEGLIAMGLLAMVAAGTFGVLLSVAHKSNQPDIREEMVLAVESASDWLQVYSQNMVSDLDKHHSTVQLCSKSGNPLADGAHNIDCLLPYICDRSNSEFKYKVYDSDMEFDFNDAKYVNTQNFQGGSLASNFPQRKIEFEIKCNGFSL